MKKVISLILAIVMCLPLCACGNNSIGDNSIELTLENYKDYLDIRAYAVPAEDCVANNDSFFDMNGKRCGASSISSYLYVKAYVEGVSDNFTYSDIVIKVRVTGKHILCDPNNVDGFRTMYSRIVNADFTQSLTCDLNVSGKGEGKSTEKYSFSGNEILPDMMFAKCYDFDCEIISISGKVVPVK